MMKILIILLFVSTSCFSQEPDTSNVYKIRDAIGFLWQQINLNTAAIATKASTTDLNLKANLISPSLTTPNIGAATGTSLSVTGSIGYGTGAGGTVTQTGNKGTAVTLNKISGQITTTNAALAAAAEVSFTFNNSFIAATDVVFVSIASGGTAGSYFVNVGSTGSGVCTITLGNVSAGSLSQAVVLNFIVFKSSNN